MYNASNFLRECIDSILGQTFTDFELLIVDDGSTDDSCGIIESYKDERIRLIRNRHDYIESLNLLLDEAKGEYIARMDADDKMLPDRLKTQVSYMVNNPCVDVMAGSMKIIGTEQATAKEEEISVYNLLEGCCMSHPTVMIRKSSIQKYNVKYESDYIYAEDYRLWCELIKKGATLRNISKPLIEYRVSNGQTSEVNKSEQVRNSRRIQTDLQKWIIEQEDKAKNDYPILPPSKNEMTVIIPFMNEGEEVGITVRSARETAGERIDIIVINDKSTDGYDYERDLKGLNVIYIINKFNIGAAAAKEKGVQLARTPYFIIIDAHMRFYNDNWLNRYLDELKLNDRRILCCQTRWLKKEGTKTIDTGGAHTCGAYLTFDSEEIPPQIHWNVCEEDEMPQNGRIPAVLGATYGASKAYWNKIKGLKGLIHYGCEEAYLSIKAYKEGGSCGFLKDITIGHIYRDKAPYRVRNTENTYNNFLIIRTLFPVQLRYEAIERYRQANPILTDKIERLLSQRVKEWGPLRRYYTKSFKENFKNIIDKNKTIQGNQKGLTEEDKGLLRDTFNYLKGTGVPYQNNIYDGKMARIIYYCLYSKIMGDQSADDLASSLFEEVESQISNLQAITLRTGICGIGWGIMYLHSNGLVDDVEDILGKIDYQVMSRDLRRISDYSFEEGLGGILCYISQRIILYKENASKTICTQYLQELWEKADDLLKLTNIDCRSRDYAQQALDLVNIENEEAIPLRLESIFDFPGAINKRDKKLWEPSIDNILGFGLKLMT